MSRKHEDSKITKICDTFADEQQNALYTAIHKAAGCDDLVHDYGVYKFIEETPRASLVCEIVDALNALGYDIIRKQETKNI